MISGTENEEQRQTVACNLHLDPSGNTNQNQPESCSCYTSEQCQEPGYISINLRSYMKS